MKSTNWYLFPLTINVSPTLAMMPQTYPFDFHLCNSYQWTIIHVSLHVESFSPCPIDDIENLDNLLSSNERTFKFVDEFFGNTKLTSSRTFFDESNCSMAVVMNSQVATFIDFHWYAKSSSVLNFREAGEFNKATLFDESLFKRLWKRDVDVG